MLTALLIIGLILFILILLIIILLFMPITVRVNLNNTDLSITARCLGIPLFRYPEKQSPAKAKKQKKKPKTTTGKLPAPPKDADVEALIQYVKTLLEKLTDFTKRCNVKLYRLHVVSKSGTAADAALWHTATAGGVAAILELLDQNTNLIIVSRDAVSIQPNFTDQKPIFTLNLTLTFALYRIFTLAAREVAPAQ